MEISWILGFHENYHEKRFNSRRLTEKTRFKSDKDFKIAKEVLNNFDTVSLLSSSSLDLSIALYRSLRKKGITIFSSIDSIIAAFCVKNNLRLLSKDKDFRFFQDHFLLDLVS